MTGTADTEAFEFSSIYVDTVAVPTNRPMIVDLPDLVYMTEAEKIEAIIEDIKERTCERSASAGQDDFISRNLKWSPELTKARASNITY